MSRPLLSLTALLLGATLVTAQTPPPPTTPSSAPKNIVQHATDFAEKYLLLPEALLAEVDCYPDPLKDTGLYACTAPVHPGITNTLTDFFCSMKGCFRFLGSTALPPSVPTLSTPAK